MSYKVLVLDFFRNIFKIKILESWLVRRSVDKSPDHFISKLVPNPYQYKTLTFRLFERNDVRLNVDISDYVGHYTYFGFLDPSQRKLFSLCKKGFNVIDVGANIGGTLLNLANISNTGTVIGFEPDPYNWGICKKNIALNPFKNITLLPYALGETNAVFKMEVRTPTNRGGNRITAKTDNDTVDVEAKKLDDVENIKALNSIDLIKIDVEGYELKTLKGAINSLTKYKPILFIEIDDENLKYQGDSAAAVFLFLSTLGYNKIIMADDGSAISVDIDLSNCHFDIVAYHESAS